MDDCNVQSSVNREHVRALTNGLGVPELTSLKHSHPYSILFLSGKSDLENPTKASPFFAVEPQRNWKPDNLFFNMSLKVNVSIDLTPL